MSQELTDLQKQWIMLHSEEHTIISLAERFDVAYYTIYNFCTKNNLKVCLNEHRKPQKRKTGPKDISYAELLKERAAVIPDPPRKWERVKGEYSNLNR